MAPVKFDDLSKTATSALNDDYQVSGYVLKAKQKTSWHGSVLTTQVDLSEDQVKTPAKLTWKLPAPVGCKHVVVDKLELDKSGKFKLEASTDKVYPGLKVECKSDLADLHKVLVGCTYTGLKDAQLKFECKATNPKEFTAEATYSPCSPATCGLKFTSGILTGGLPDVGLRWTHGPLFCTLLAKDNIGAINAAAAFDANSDVKCAATYNHTMKSGKGIATIGVVYKELYKLKLAQDQTVCASVKHDFAKGFSTLIGLKFNAKKQDFTYGFQVSIE